MEGVMHGFNGYQVTMQGRHEVIQCSVPFVEFQGRKHCKTINVEGTATKVPETVDLVWRHFRRFDKEYANNIVKSYKAVWQFMQFENSRDALDGVCVQMPERRPWAFMMSLTSKQHPEHHVHIRYRDDMKAIELVFGGPWHTIDEWPVAPAISGEEVMYPIYFWEAVSRSKLS
jgi:hypothetical protein